MYISTRQGPQPLCWICDRYHWRPSATVMVYGARRCAAVWRRRADGEGIVSWKMSGSLCVFFSPHPLLTFKYLHNQGVRLKLATINKTRKSVFLFSWGAAEVRMFVNKPLRSRPGQVFSFSLSCHLCQAPGHNSFGCALTSSSVQKSPLPRWTSDWSMW